MADEVSLIGVYDADGTLTGEVRYWVGARFGRAHCSLCDITHGLFRAKPEWRSCVASLPVRFETFHRDDAPRDVLERFGDSLPVVVARRGSELHVVLNDEQLEAVHGDVAAFLSALDASCRQLGIELSEPAT